MGDKETVPTRAEPAVLAVDGGASKTDVVVIDRHGGVLGRARGGPSNHQMVGLDAAMDNLGATIAAARDAVGLVPGNGAGPLCRTGVYCLAGVDLDIDERRVGQAVAERGWTTDVELHNDTFAILRAGMTSGWGVGVVCGTGLNCVGLGPNGSSVRFPALGELSGDFTPGGAWLGVRGLGLALRAGDGRGDATLLETAVPDHFGLPDPETVLEAVYTGEISYGRLPELGELVLHAAATGDGPSRQAVEQLVAEVVAMVGATIARLGTPNLPIEVVVGGGIFEDPDFARLVLEGVRAHSPGAALRPISGPPVLGAALLGLDAIAAGGGAEAALRAVLV